MTIRRLTLGAYLCLAFLSAAAQNKPHPYTGTVWTNRASRTVYVDTTIQHAATDTSLAQILTMLVLDKQLTAYSTIDRRFSTRLTKDQVLEKISAHADDADQLEDPVTGSIPTRVVRHDYNYDNIRAYRLLEEWRYKVDEGKIDIQIVGVAPVQRIYGDDGNYRGSVAMYWLKYEDVKDIITQFNTRYPKDNWYQPIWKSYCNGDRVTFTNGNLQSGTTSRTIIMLDTIDYYSGRKLMSADDTLLPQTLIERAGSGAIPVYDTADRSYPTPLKKTAIDAATYVQPDTMELDTESATRRFKVRKGEFKYEWVTNYQIEQQVMFNTATGSISIQLISVLLKRDNYDDRGYFTGMKKMFSFQYSDIQPIINRYTMQHPFCNLPLELWRGYFTEKE